MITQELLAKAVSENVSDIFIVAGRPATFRQNNRLVPLEGAILLPADTRRILTDLYALADRAIEPFDQTGDDDFAIMLPGVSRFRVSAYRQRSTCSAVIRVVNFEIPSAETLELPQKIMDLALLRKGLVLITGPAGSGKSTTLACIIDRINHTAEKHIITLEDPVEYLHRHDRSIISQRDIELDTTDYVHALRSALRQSPDVILLGEMRDYETINVAMTAAETGHLLFSSLHTIGAANTIDRIIDVFPANQQRQIATQLSMVLDTVISQQLVPGIDGEFIPAFEIMTVTPAIRNMIRENRIAQIEGQLYASARPDMISMDQSLLALYKKGRITKETALMYATSPELLEKKL